MKRVLTITAVLLSLSASQALAQDWDYYGPETLSAEPNMTITAAMQPEEEEMAELEEMESLPMAGPMAPGVVPSRSMWAYECPNCCDSVWSGYQPKSNCCGSAWAGYRGKVRGWCDEARCKVSSLRPTWGADSCGGCDMGCCEPAPVVCESCCDPCGEVRSCKKFSLDRLRGRISDCCPDFDFCSTCNSGCDMGCDCDMGYGCVDPCAECGHRWFGGGLLSGLFHKHDDCCCESGMWQEGEVIYDYDGYDSIETLSPVPAEEVQPAAEDHSARRLRMPSVSLPDWMRF